LQVPSATYRIQFHPEFKLCDATRLIPYLRELGISHIYASPLLKASPGSRHGYDCIDPREINPELGSCEEFEAFVAELRRNDMSLLLDIVPNHMAASDKNPWWMDVLENGRESAYADFFDIDWDAHAAKSPEIARNRVLLPILGDFYERMLTERKIELRLDAGGFHLETQGTRLPIAPPTYDAVLRAALEKLGSSEEETPARQSLNEAAAIIVAADADSLARAKDLLWRVYCESRHAKNALDSAMGFVNGANGEPASFARLDELISKQNYRLLFWRAGKDEVNYRRFFGLSNFVGLREENSKVFDAVHEFIFRLIARSCVSGLRIDHIDGLSDPLDYLRRLQRAIASEPDELSPNTQAVYTVVEKITSGDEQLPTEWPTAGTTGYDFANALNTLFIDAQGSRQLEAIYRDYTGIRTWFSDTWYARKRQVMEELFEADIQLLAALLGRIAAQDPLGRDLPIRELVRGMKEITARLGVYRTYFRSLDAHAGDRRYLEEAIQVARERTPSSGVSKDSFDFLERVFLLQAGAEPPAYAEEWLEFIERWQQFTGAVMAKGFEDTAFFVHHGLISLNEVGANPFRRQIRFGVGAFHRYLQNAFAAHPFTLNATSTHDTKWSEDARARINVLSEFPGEWKERLSRWGEMNGAKRTLIDRITVPSPNEEILLYQSMLGIWPFEPLEHVDLAGLSKRIDTFMLKAMREAKTHSNWISPNEQHEGALHAFIAGILDPGSSQEFLSDFSDFARSIAVYGAVNGFSQALLKMTVPGVPDIYQGAELWRLSLTDPDNRRPVSYPRREEFLHDLSEMQLESAPAKFAELLEGWDDGRLKLWLTKAVLNYRRENRDLFGHGAYIPLHVEGHHADSIFAFARAIAKRWVLVIAPRVVSRLIESAKFPLGDVWQDAALQIPKRAPSAWRDLLTGQYLNCSDNTARKSLRVAEALRFLPFACLVSQAQTECGKY
jgi:(1->4)-alpha-D-glucan 1-alpha-D-glucosylmutase